MKRGIVYHTVKAPDFYGAFEEIGHHALKDGMKIRVCWRGGKVTNESLRISTGTRQVQVDMNLYPDTYHYRTLSVFRSVNGVKVLVPLKGLKVAVL